MQNALTPCFAYIIFYHHFINGLFMQNLLLVITLLFFSVKKLIKILNELFACNFNKSCKLENKHLKQI